MNRPYMKTEAIVKIGADWLEQWGANKYRLPAPGTQEFDALNLMATKAAIRSSDASLMRECLDPMATCVRPLRDLILQAHADRIAARNAAGDWRKPHVWRSPKARRVFMVRSGR